MEEKLVKILNEMADYLNISQMKKLQETLLKHLAENEAKTEEIPNVEYLKMFIDAKQIEGCSERTLQYYRVTIEHMLGSIDTPIRKITTDEIRGYLVDYQKVNNCSKVTVDNVRRNMSSFFSWLEEEDYILKSPMRRIHKIKTKQPVKETITDEMIEKLRDNCTCVRDLAMIDLLYSTGIRVGELVGLNISDIDFEERECIVFGKGDKERRVYFDAKAKLHLQEYIESRTDDNPALFVTLDAPHARLKIIKIDYGQKIGKTIIFAKNHTHAEKIFEVFNEEYPHLVGYAEVIDNQTKFAQKAIDDFSDPKKLPQIAISVDMLDTGIDVPEILNLVFFKKVIR